MGLLIEMDGRTLESLGGEIDEVQKKLQAECSSEEMESFNKELDDCSNEWEKQISSTKSKKFQRDVQDKEQNKMFRWSHQKSEMEKPGSVGTSISDSSSVASGSTSTHTERFQPYNTRYQNGRKRKQVGYEDSSSYKTLKKGKHFKH
ncbi:uncharacterized protein ACNLHF_019090 [Anomaloglossus baeobatrachus]